ncbi:hypothetical protein F8M41_017226 [Gigaspora margarita]|uniref:Uncharacterized protein n=1 Tax=Gigaspora margarita TaxID=4874 RepID=A0A8H4ANI0_GIGMA|nr:hypothetical protein F8M41_017226 [Gigaspora margarita]
MSNFKCTFCSHTYKNCNGLSKHMNVCVFTSSEDEQLFANNPAQVHNYSKLIKQNQNKNFDINEYKLDNELASSLDNMSFELDNSNINSNMFEVNLTSNLLDDLETTIDEDQKFSNKILNNSTYFKHI